MSNITDEHIEKILDKMKLIDLNDIPGIDLYMDQVTTLMEEKLGSLKRYPDDKILTKTMINNYAKNDLLPPPEKKKYSTEHIIMLIFIYYFKNFLTIGDIKTLTSHLTTNHFHKEGDQSLTNVYTELLNHFPLFMDSFRSEAATIENVAEECIKNIDSDDEYLKKFMTIAFMGIDLYMRKQLIESMIDELSTTKSDSDSNDK